MTQVIELFGWFGTAAIVGAYALVSFAVLDPDSLLYQLLNGVGATGIVLVSLNKRAYQPALLNTIWAAIAAIAIARVIL
jgi:hypothetical protein